MAMATAAHADAAVLWAMGPAVPAELPGGVRAWWVTRHDVVQRLTGDPCVSRDAFRHWPGLANVPGGWPPAAIQGSTRTTPTPSTPPSRTREHGTT
ncbi:hypothetical protein [Streptantibioticus silvisoli]|uniref:Uncharacterized protein n=1 Tax=Streptantibioticus silvisoli TaxID=2705255 RepID=A0ABT6W1H6_9ACTN|nr:hypothetical protein [Streptantibioticus silvisoli]MDI5964605.1 hypothetical protein [Streptantibioticus silvisoli]